MARYLDAILAFHRARYEQDGRDENELEEAARSLSVCAPARDFTAALSSPGLSLIAEIKRRSPSRGDLDLGLDPGEVAAEYARGGAACLSVLTDEAHFGGCASDLASARAAVDIPVLRKDFTIGRRDVYDARIMGADAVLLIAAALATEELEELRRLAEGLGMAALIEVHDEDEAARAEASGAGIVGVNQRDLRTFAVDAERAVRIRAFLDDSLLTVAESGISTPADLEPLARAGFDAVLVGEALVVSGDRVGAAGSFAGTARTAARPCG